MTDVRNALHLSNGNSNNRKKKYKEGIEGYDSKKLGYFTSKYFECIDDSFVKMSNDKQRSYLDIASKIALKSPVYTHKHGAIIIYKDKIIASGFNYYVGDFSIHAEVAAISHVKKKQRYILNECDIYIVRIGPDSLDNPLKYSRPCPNCQNTIKKYNIKNAYYSTSYDYDDIRCSNDKVHTCTFQ